MLTRYSYATLTTVSTGCDMELLLVVAMDLADETCRKHQNNFKNLESHPEVCLDLINELQTRINGYELADYAKAMAYAVNSLRAKAET